MAQFSFTPEQKAAIKTNEGPVLVSAGAGSGKTRVLVQRLLRKLEEGGNITDYLVITYTKAAATELKTRIMEGISKLLAKNPANTALRKQSYLIHKANIGTIHSFCIGIIHENVHLLDISPDFRVVEENEARALKDMVLERIIEERYAKIDEDGDFRALIDATSAGHDDTKLVNIIKETYEKLQSHPYPEDWMNEQCKKLDKIDEDQDAAQTVWGRIILENVSRNTLYWRKRISELLNDADECDEFIKAYGDSLAVTEHSLCRFIKACGQSWDEAVAAAKIDFPRPKNVKGYDEYKNIRKRCKAAMEKQAKVFEASSRELMRGMVNVRPVINGLFSVVNEFGEKYSAEKRYRGLIDFSDQEHMAVKLLTDRKKLKPTVLAKSISHRYSEIMVDEYQDVNAVQELIFNAVSRNGKNIFMVGDVKQSIYRFRLADPSIFMEKYNSFKIKPVKAEGRKILLKKNFRSDKGVLDCVNFVFKNIMSLEFGEMQYTQEEYLEWGGTTDASDNLAVELDVIDADDVDDESSLSKSELEAEFVAKRIKELSCKYRYCEIAILLRSVREKSRIYSAALKKAGIPVQSDGSEEFYKTLEITVMLSLLTVIDNPRQDIPLISVLRSPIYGFTADELAEIRLCAREVDYYSAIIAASSTMKKAESFLKELEQFRNAASEMPTDKLIWYIYDKTGFVAVAAAMDGGSNRVENLMCLFEYARSYENNGCKGLFSFITYIRKQMENGEDPHRKSGSEQDAVQIMSVHKSKGLEFPVVFIADMSKRFNQTDSRASMLIHPKLGAGPKLIDQENHVEYDTLARQAVAAVLKKETLAEELRVLYVAMTRAKEKLIMTCSYGNYDKQITKLLPDAALPVEPEILASASSMADWILLTALNRSEASEIRCGETVIPYDDGSKWIIRLITANEAKLNEAALQRTAPDKREDDKERINDITYKLEWKYDYHVTDVPSKLTATELKGRFQDYEAQEEAEQLEPEDQPVIIRTPEFISADERKLTAAEKGTALHLAMQYIDYSKCCFIDDIKAELDRLEMLGILDKKQKKAVSPWKIFRFFRSELGERILNTKKLYREFKFSLLVPAEIWYNDAADDEVLLQGVIDCCIVEDDGLVIIDYKTDYVDDDNINTRADFYRNQLEAYSIAMEKITGLKTKEMILYFFSKDYEFKL